MMMSESPLPGDTRRAVDLLLEARRSHQPAHSFDPAMAPRTENDAYRIQDLVAEALIPDQGPVIGWKVGAASPSALPFAAPLHNATIFHGDTTLRPDFCRFHGIEAELVYRFGRDLPLRAQAWSLSEVLDAVESVHSAIEIIDTRFERPNSQPRLDHLADQASHGALVVGRGTQDWRGLNPVTETVHLSFDDGRLIEHIGGNSAGDPRRLLLWLANHAMARHLPIRAGTIVTTGSMTETLFVASGCVATARIAHLPPVRVVID